ncbi:MAG: MmgE/PrpD family protein [Candidatus Methylomirabilales bacterium]
MPTTLEFIHETSWREIPSDVKHMAARCALDLTGTLIAGSATELSQVARKVALRVHPGDQASLLLDGRKTNSAGAALANGMTIDSIDAHDGYRLAKGHAGAGIYPAALAVGEQRQWSGQDWLTALVIGYEIALRAGESLHQSAADYHTSGAWVAIGAAAVAARAYTLESGGTRHALGIAEYHGPRSEMMRCIDHPTMLKDGSGWGSMTGLVAAEFARAGFTGAPATTVEDDFARSIWQDLGTDWRMRKLYFKPYACCRWAHPAIDAALELTATHGIAGEEISALEVFTFEEATRLDLPHPLDTEQAQYSLPFPVAAAILLGGLEPAHLQRSYLEDDRILQLADKVVMTVDPQLDRRFPAEALARVRLSTTEGQVVESGIVTASGGPESPMSDAQLTEKFQVAISGLLPEQRAAAIQRACWDCAQLDSVHELIALLREPIQ